MRPLDVGNLAALIDWNGYSFVVLDTLARCMVGADENSAKDCGIAVDSITRLLSHTPEGRGVLLGVHHAGKDGKTLRGSSAFEGAADTVYFTSRDRAVIVDHHLLKLDPIVGTGSCTISNSSTTSHDLSADRLLDATDKLMSAFVRHFTQTGATKAELRLVAEMPPATFHRALGKLLERGDLINNGTDKQPFYRTR
jgi:AAA domain